MNPIDPSFGPPAGPNESTPTLRRLSAGDYCLAIDQGTTSTRATLFDSNGATVASARRMVDIHRSESQSGHVEQDAEQIATSVDEVICEVVDSCDDVERITVAGLATQRSSVVAWDRETGRALSPVLSWQDTRCSDVIHTMQHQSEEVTQRSGLPLTAHYGATKIAWLLHNDHEYRPAIARAQQANRLVIGPLATFVLQSMTVPPDSPDSRPALADHANAGRTQLMNVATGDWDPWLLETFRVPREVLPQIVPIESAFGNIQKLRTNVTVVQGDQTAAIFGYGSWNEEWAHVNLGTGGFVLSMAPEMAGDSRLVRSVSYSRCETSQASLKTDRKVDSQQRIKPLKLDYVLEGTVNGCGAALDWAAKRLGVQVEATNIERWLSKTNHTMIFLNTVGGLGSPFWRSSTGASNAGWVDHNGNRFQPVSDEWDAAMCAVLDSVLFLIRANLEAMQNARRLTTAPELRHIRVTGGLSRSDAYCQRLADVTQLSVTRPEITEATSRGVGWLAAGKPESWIGALTPNAAGTWVPRKDLRLPSEYEQFLKRLDLVV